MAKEKTSSKSNPAPESAQAKKKHRVTIHSHGDEKYDVDLTVNGRHVRVKRDVPVVLEEAFVGVLKNSVIQTIDKDPETGKETPRTIPRFPFSIEPA